MVEICPIEVRVQGMVCELLEDTKARFEKILEFLAEEVRGNQQRLEEEKHTTYGNPAMYQGFLDGNLEQIADMRHGIASLDNLIAQAKELRQKLANFWEEHDKAHEHRMEKIKEKGDGSDD